MVKIVVKRKKNGQMITLSFVALFAVLWILMGFNLDNPDYMFYENLFYRVESGITTVSVEGGFLFLVKIAVGIGINYQIFLICYSAFGLILICSSIIKYTKKPSFVLIAYFCYPFLLDLTQLRHFMAVAIFVFSIRYLKEYNAKNLIKYCALILIAASQQILALSFLVYLLVYMNNSKRAIRIAVVLTIFNLVGFKYILKSSLVEKIFSLRGKEVNYVGGYSIGQVIMYGMFFGVLLVLCYILYRNDMNKDKSYDFIFKICMYSSIFIPFIMIDFQYTRLFRASIIIIYIYISNQISKLNKRDMFIWQGFFLVFMIFIWIKLFGPGSGYFEEITCPVFQSNSILNGILN